MAVSSDTIRNIVLVDTVRPLLSPAAYTLPLSCSCRLSMCRVCGSAQSTACRTSCAATCGSTRRELGTEKKCDSLCRYLLGVCNPDKSEVAPNEKQLSDEFADVVGGISNETLFRRARC